MPVLVELQWLGPEEGGRNTPPAGPQYTTVAKLEALADKWPSEAWSIVIEWHEPPGDDLRIEARMKFLVPDGPEHLLAPGSHFALYEGHRQVAHGRVVKAIL